MRLACAPRLYCLLRILERKLERFWGSFGVVLGTLSDFSGLKVSSLASRELVLIFFNFPFSFLYLLPWCLIECYCLSPWDETREISFSVDTGNYSMVWFFTSAITRFAPPAKKIAFGPLSLFSLFHWSTSLDEVTVLARVMDSYAPMVTLLRASITAFQFQIVSNTTVHF